MHHQGSINAPGKPYHRRQVVKYTSSHGATLIDMAEENIYGGLCWVAMPLDDERYQSILDDTFATMYPV